MNNETPLYSSLKVVLRRDLLIAFRKRSDIVNPLLFFVIVAIIMFLNGDMQEMIEAQQAAKKATAYTASAFKNWTS